MTPEQEALAEKIIATHKQYNGLFNWTPYNNDNTTLLENLFVEKNYEQLQFIKNKLVELSLIEVINATGNRTQLLVTGFEFTSFAETRKKKQKKRMLRKLNIFRNCTGGYLLLLDILLAGRDTNLLSVIIFP